MKIEDIQVGKRYYIIYMEIMDNVVRIGEVVAKNEKTVVVRGMRCDKDKLEQERPEKFIAEYIEPPKKPTWFSRLFKKQ